MGMVFDGLTVEGELGGILDRTGLLRKWPCRRRKSIKQESGGHSSQLSGLPLMDCTGVESSDDASGGSNERESGYSTK